MSNADDADFAPSKGLQENMQNVIDQIDLAYKQLREERDKLRDEQGAMNVLRDRIRQVSATAPERLKINVGGTRFEICLRHSEKNTYFRSLNSGTFVAMESDGFYFIDKDPKYVPIIMAALRDDEINLDPYNERELVKIRADAEFYMVPELSNKIDRKRSTRLGGGIQICTVNRGITDLRHVNGIFFELRVKGRGIRLHSIAFRAGERRRLVGQALLKEGGIDQTNRPLQSIGEVEQQADRGQTVTITFSSLPLSANTVYTIGVYSSSCPTAISVCPRSLSERDFSHHGFTITKTYHNTDPRGNVQKRAGEDEFDFVGELALSTN